MAHENELKRREIFQVLRDAICEENWDRVETLYSELLAFDADVVKKKQESVKKPALSRDCGLLAALQFANSHCSCESYYNHQCRRCRSMAEGTAPDMTEALRMEYVSYEGYGAPNLTPLGRNALDLMIELSGG